MNEIRVGKCRQDTCSILVDGKCLEGFPEGKNCPYFLLMEERDSTESVLSRATVLPNEPSFSEETNLNQIDSPLTDETEIVFLPDGNDLKLETSHRICVSSLCRVIVIAGSHRSGKTTLLSSLYEMFQKGPFAGYIFAGSETLPGWEKRCHLARISSQRSSPDTERTKVADESLLHLKVRREDLSNPIQNLLFSDLAGERFRLARDSTEECQKLHILRRADHFVLLLDGAKLLEQDQRQEVFIDARLLLRSCLDARMLGLHSYVDVLFTKCDLFESISNTSGVKEFLESIKVSFRAGFETKVKRLRFFEVAARPENRNLPYAYNLELFFPSWIEDFPQRRYFSPNLSSQIKPIREFDRFPKLLPSHNV